MNSLQPNQAFVTSLSCPNHSANGGSETNLHTTDADHDTTTTDAQRSHQKHCLLHIDVARSVQTVRLNLLKKN